MTSDGQQDVKMMTLDDVIKANLKSGSGKRLSFRNRRRSYFRRRYLDEKPKQDNRRRIQVENLSKEMQNPELQKLFEPFGKLTRCGIKFDKLGVSKGLADVEFSSHEECEKAIMKLDNADVNGEIIRVKYAPNQYSRMGRRTRSVGMQRRRLRKINRSRSRGIRNRRSTRRGTRRTSGGRQNFRQKRRNFARTLGRRIKEKKQN